MKRQFILAALALACAGCTAPLIVKRVADDDPNPPVGSNYSLSYTQFPITIHREVTGCDKTSITMKTKVDVGVAASAIDKKQNFVIDNNSVNGPFKYGGVTVTYAAGGGATAGMNASSTDRSAQVLSNVIGTLVSLSTMGTPSAVPAAPVTDDEKAIAADKAVELQGFALAQDVDSAKVQAFRDRVARVPKRKKNEERACSDAVWTGLQEVKARSADVTRLGDAATKAAGDFLDVKTRMDALGGIASDAQKGELFRAKALVDSTAAALALMKDRLDAARAAVSEDETFNFPEDGSTFKKPVTVDANYMDRWRPSGVTGANGGPPLDLPKTIVLTIAHAGKTVPADEADQAELAARIAKAKAAGLPESSVAAKPQEPAAIPGVPYRRGQLGSLLVCETDCKAKQVKETPATILQLGPIYYLPCQSVMFSSTSCAMAFDASGYATSIGSDQKSSSGEGATGALKDAAGQLAGASKAKLDAQAAAVTAQVNLQKALNDLTAARKAAAAQPYASLDSIKAATASEQAQADYWTAVKANADAKAALAS